MDKKEVTEKKKKNKIDFKYLFPNVYGCEPSKTITIVEMELSALIKKEVLKKSPTTVYVTERRGVNLYHPFFNRIILRGHKIGYVRNYHDTPMVEINCPKVEKNNSAIILTDAIRRGKEISAILKTLKEEEIKVSKVCSYLADINTIQELRREHEGISFEYVHGSSNYDEYKSFGDKLIPVHHSRIEPLGSDHPYNIYQCMTKLNKKEIKEMLKQVCSGHSEFHDDKKLCSKNIIGFTAEYDDYSSFQSTLSHNCQDIVDFERIKIRFRYDKYKKLLGVMAFCSTFIYNTQDVNTFNCKENGFMFSLADVYLYCNDVPEYIVAVDCARCIDTNMSQNILNIIEDNLYKVSSENGHRFENVSEYNPFSF